MHGCLQELTYELVLEDFSALAKDPGRHWVICIPQLKSRRFSEQGLRQLHLHAGQLGPLVRSEQSTWVHNVDSCNGEDWIMSNVISCCQARNCILCCSLDLHSRYNAKA